MAEAYDGSALVGILERAELERRASARYASALSRAAANRNRYEKLHKLYAPIDGDQWPEDRMKRPGKLHVSANIVKAFVDTEARLLSILPRITNKPDAQDDATQRRAEVVEDLFMRWLEASGWDMWMSDLNRGASLYGIGYLKPVWNEAERRPDVELVEQPQNVMIGYGSSNFKIVDWAIYAYSVSPTEAKGRWPEIEITNRRGKEPLVTMRGSDHSDPLNQRSGVIGGALESINRAIRKPNAMDGEYEQQHVTVWDYWYRKPRGPICNAILVNGTLVDGPHEHPEYPAIPYIPVERDHEPGSPDGVSTAEPLTDVQNGLNRAISDMAQYVADETATAWQLTGDNADSVPEGIVPRAGEIVAAGPGNRIEPITRGANQYPYQALIDTYWQTAHKVTGLSEVLFGNLPGGQASGRALAVQIEAAINRLDPKRRRLYEGLKRLMLFWGYMIEKKNVQVPLTETAAQPAADAAQNLDPTAVPPEPATRSISLADVIKGLNRWRIVAPEITPRDVMEHTQNTINKVQSKLLPLEWGMDEVGVENPKMAKALIEIERSNPGLFPADAQAKAAVKSTLLQLMMAAQQMGMSPGQAGEAANENTGQQAPAQAAAQEAAPTLTEDQNQPMTQEGSAPPPGAPSPLGGELQMLVRQTPGGESQSMSQIKTSRPI